MRQGIGQLAIIGQQDQAFAIQIKPSYRKNTCRDIDQVDNCGTTMSIFRGRNHPCRLV
jgi:hypothetical protein